MAKNLETCFSCNENSYAMMSQMCDRLQEEQWDPALTEQSGFVMTGGGGSHRCWDE